MTGKKIMVNVNIEVLSIDVVPSVLMDVIDQFQKEHPTGSFTSDDGDMATWSTVSVDVSF